MHITSKGNNVYLFEDLNKMHYWYPDGYRHAKIRFDAVVKTAENSGVAPDPRSLNDLFEHLYRTISGRLLIWCYTKNEDLLLTFSDKKHFS